MDIRHEFTLQAKAQTVFEAVSTEKGIQSWWSKNSTVGQTVGTESTLNFVKEGTPVVMGFITRTLETNSKVIWECISMPNPAWIGTKLITEISESESGTVVVFSHSGFDEKWSGHDAFEQTKLTWNHFVSSLQQYCETGQGQAW